jgi:hypothetical protein
VEEYIPNPRQGVSKLKSRLRGKRVLIILDNIWEAQGSSGVVTLDCLEAGSCILKTTRDGKTLGGKGVQYDLDVLDSQAAWDLFCWHAFSGTTEHCPEQLKASARTVVERCGGLPLALEVTGAWVAEETRELSEAEVDCWWKEELMKKLPELGNTESPERGPSVLEILKSSYNRLPQALKEAFVLLPAWYSPRYIDRDIVFLAC